MQVNATRTYGIALFPPAFAILLFIDIIPIPIIVHAVLLLGIADALAGWYGTLAGKNKIVFLKEPKTWEGFGVFFVAAFFISLIYWNDYSLHGWLLAILLAIIPALSELFSYKGSDNFSLPIITVIWYLLIYNQPTVSLLYIGLIAMAASLLACCSYLQKMVDYCRCSSSSMDGIIIICQWLGEGFCNTWYISDNGQFIFKIESPYRRKGGQKCKAGFCEWLDWLNSNDCFLFYKGYTFIMDLHCLLLYKYVGQCKF
jgi:hypothetical protein